MVSMNAIKVLNLTDDTFIIDKLGDERVTRAIQYLPHSSYSIIKELDWNKDVHIAKFITKFIIEQEVIRRLEKPEYVVLDVPEEHRHIVKETLDGVDVKVLYIKTEQVETEDGRVIDMKSVVEGMEPKPKRILNLADYVFTDKQIRDIYDEDYILDYPVVIPQFESEEDDVTTAYINHYANQIQDEINKQLSYPDCVILDVPDIVIPYIESKFFGSNIRFIYVKAVFVEMIDRSSLKVKQLSKIEE